MLNRSLILYQRLSEQVSKM